MLLVLVLFHLFPFWSSEQRYSRPNLIFIRVYVASSFLLLILCTLHIAHCSAHLLSHNQLSSVCAFLVWSFLSSCVCAVLFLVLVFANTFECSLHLHWEIYTISLILIGYDDLVWRTKTRSYTSVSVWFGLVWFCSIRIYVHIFIHVAPHCARNTELMHMP